MKTILTHTGKIYVDTEHKFETVGRKYTLNFPVTSQTILNAKEKLFDREKFIVKITPIHETASAIENGFQVTGYSDYRRFEQPLLKEGWDVCSI